MSQKLCPKKAFLKDNSLFVVCNFEIIIINDELETGQASFPGGCLGFTVYADSSERTPDAVVTSNPAVATEFGRLWLNSGLLWGFGGRCLWAA